MKQRLIVCALALLALVGFAVMAQAQTPTYSLSWDYPNDLPATVAGWTQSVTFDGTALTASPACTPLGTVGTTCTVPLGTPASGPHTAVIAATAGSVTASTSVSGLNLASAANAHSPGNVKVKINISINLP